MTFHVFFLTLVKNILIMAEKKKYTIEELNQYIIATEKLTEYYVNKAMIDNTQNSPDAARCIRLKEKLMIETEKLLNGLEL